MKFLQRRAGRYEFRFPLPDDLAGKPVPHHWPKALAALVNARRAHQDRVHPFAPDQRPRDRRILPHIAEAHRLFDQARRVLRDGPATGLERDRIAAMARDHEIQLLAADEALRAKGLVSRF